jgi:hypothetical protein
LWIISHNKCYNLPFGTPACGQKAGF